MSAGGSLIPAACTDVTPVTGSVQPATYYIDYSGYK